MGIEDERKGRAFDACVAGEYDSSSGLGEVETPALWGSMDSTRSDPGPGHACQVRGCFHCQSQVSNKGVMSIARTEAVCKDYRYPRTLIVHPPSLLIR
jgi:hypothetical protein